MSQVCTPFTFHKFRLHSDFDFTSALLKQTAGLCIHIDYVFLVDALLV